MFRCIKSLQAFLLLVLWICVPARSGHAQQYNLTFEHLTTRHGLPGSRVNAILQDRQGFLWIGTESGLARYDGYVFANYRPGTDDESRVPNSRVNALFEDEAGTLWVGFREGLYALEQGSDTLVQHLLGQNVSGGSPPVRTILGEGTAVLWVGTDSGLVRLDRRNGTLERYVHDPADPQSLSSDAVNDIVADPDGALWIGTDRGLNRFDRVAGTFTRYLHDAADARSLSHSTVTDLLSDRRGVLWVATPGGLNRLDAGTGTFTRYVHRPGDPTSLRHDAVQTILEDHTGTLWVGTWGGTDGGTLHTMNREDGRFVRYAHTPHDPVSLRRNYAILSLYEDRAGVLWIGTGGGYLHKLDATTRHFVRYRRHPGQSGSLGETYVFSVHEDRAGEVWVGTADGLDRFDRKTGRYTSYRHEPGNPRGLAHNHVRAIYEDREGALWIGTEGGLDRFDRATNGFTHHGSISGGEDPVWVTEIYEDRQRRLWIGTNQGLRWFDRQARRFVVPEQRPRGGYVQVIYQERRGMLWVGTRDGLRLYDPEQNRFLPLPEALAPLRTCDVRAVIEDHTGRLWIGTVGDGLWQFEPSSGTAKIFSRRQGLSNNIALDVLEDRKERLWIRTLSGISRLDLASGRITNLDGERALGSNLNEWGAMWKSAGGEFIYGGDDGLVFFVPERIEDNPIPPEVVLTRFSLFNRPVQPGTPGPLAAPLSRTEEIRLSYRQDDVSFDFVALHFSGPEKNRYMYMLEPYDTAWRAAGTLRRATYTNLSPGTYVFRVKAANADGVWNEAGTAIRLVIVPPFWLRPWFFALCLAVLILAVYGGYRLRVRQLRAHAKELAQHVEERTRELVLEKRKTEAQARRLMKLDEMKSQFFANISHEFRTPLTLITGPLRDLLEGRHGGLAPEVQAQHQVMLQNAQRLLRMISELLDLAKLESGKMVLEQRPGDLIAFLRNLTRAFAPLAERKEIMLQCRAEEDRLPCLYDRDKLEKVFSNLLSNALKFTPEGGKVWLTVLVYEDVEEPFVEVVVKDTGPGIPPSGLSAIFDRFERGGGPASRLQQGTGLGLALAKELVELHRGKILVESELGFGSAFIVRLPLQRVEEEGKDAAAPLALDPLLLMPPPPEGVSADVSATEDHVPEACAAERPVVLVVEDNAEVRAYVRSHLEPTYCVLEAADGEAGLEAVRREGPDLVLCDVMMPGLSGFELCRRLKSDPALRVTPVILLTARADEQDRVEGFQVGADDYIAKPFSASELRVRVDNLLQSRAQMRSLFSRQIVVQPSGVVASSEDEAFLSSVMASVEAHLGDSAFNVAGLADELGLSRRQLHRKVQALVGESPTDLFRRIRLERGRQLLAANQATISEVAYAVGYSSPSNFARAFRDHFGVSPTEYLEQCADEAAEPA